MRKKNRSRSKISRLPPEIRNAVDEMVKAASDFTYADIKEYLAGQGVDISISAIGAYAQNLSADLEAIRVAQENFKVLVREAEKVPELEYSEVINRVAAQRMLQAIVAKPQDEWDDVRLDKLLKEMNGMTRAVAYKQRIEVQNRSDTDAALAELKAEFFSALGAEHPELYRQLVQVLEKQQKEAAL